MLESFYFEAAWPQLTVRRCAAERTLPVYGEAELVATPKKCLNPPSSSWASRATPPPRAGRVPVDEQSAKAALRVANEVLSKRILDGSMPILVTNQFPASARVANLFRHGAAIGGTADAELDPRL